MSLAPVTSHHVRRREEKKDIKFFCQHFSSFFSSLSVFITCVTKGRGGEGGTWVEGARKE